MTALPTELLIYGLPLLFLVVAAPMTLGWVPPNRFYGMRTDKTLSSPEIWYPANRAAGWFMVAAAAVALGFNLAVSAALPEDPEAGTSLWLVAGNVVPIVAAAVASHRYVRRL